MAPEEARERRTPALSRLPDGRVIAYVQAATANLAVLAPQSKLSAAIEFGPTDIGFFLVLFHPDVQQGDAERILLDNRILRIGHPDLLPSQFLIEASDQQIRDLSVWDEVAYIFPASEELIRGEPLRGCIGPLIEEGLVGQYVSTIGQGWDGLGKNNTSLTYSLAHVTTQLPRSEIERLVELAFQEWSRHASITFRKSEDTLRTRNLNLLFTAGHHGDAYPFDGKGRVLAHTFYPAGINPEPIAGDIHLDEDEPWTIGGQPDLYSVVLHEIGHALGLGHSDRPGSVMYPYYKLLTALQPDDINALQRIYAQPATQAEEPTVPTQPSQPPTLATPSTPEPSPPPQATNDNAKPVLLITFPPTTAYSTSASYLTVRGTARDNVRVESVTWQRGPDSGIADGTNTWSFTVPLLQGTNTIVIRAIDAAENIGWRSLVVRRR